MNMWKKPRRKGRYSNHSRYSRYPSSRKGKYACAKRGRPRNMRGLVAKEVRHAVKSPKLLTETKVFYKCFMANPPTQQKDGTSVVGDTLSCWPLFMGGESSALKQIIVPLSSLVPCQRPTTSG